MMNYKPEKKSISHKNLYPHYSESPTLKENSKSELDIKEEEFREKSKLDRKN